MKMTDYIKREDALKAVDAFIGTDPIANRIKLIPSADVAPVRHGKWEATEWAVNSSGAILIGRLYRCSECGRIIDLEHAETLNDYPYCHCGAKMDGGINGE